MGTDLFTAMMETRQAYVEWLGEQFVSLAAGLRLVLLGTAYKPGTGLESGSSAVLLASLLRLRGADVTVIPSPRELGSEAGSASAAAFFIGCPEPEFINYHFPPGSVVVDPWHRVPDRNGVSVSWIGEIAARPAGQSSRRYP